MISEISVHARSTNNKAKAIVCACFISSLILLVISALLDKYRGVIGIMILALITSAILLYTKYMLARYVYDLTTLDDGTPVLIARSITGKRETTLMRITLSSVVSVERLDGDSVRKYQSDTGVLKYIYSPTFMPESLILIRSRSIYEKADVLIEAPKEFEDLIRQTAEYARAYTEDEE